MGFFSKKNILVLSGVLLINLLSAYFYYRIDLSSDKKYTISDATKTLLKSLQEQIVIKVYLDGDNLPGGFERLKRAIIENLQEFKYYGGNNIDYQFVNPYDIANEEDRNKLFQELVNKGMQPTNVFDKQGGKKTENLIFPYATVWYQGKESAVLLLKNSQSENAQNNLNQSNENIEYELATAIQKLSNTNKRKIGLLTEFTKLRPVNFAGLINSLQEFYSVYIIDSKESSSFKGLDALIIPKPDSRIDDDTKFKIDQFVMSGGKVMFFVDGLKVDSIGLEGSYAQPLDVNLDDLLFNYGLRINKNIVKDGLNAAMIPMVVGNMGDKPNIQAVKYRYFPLINNFGNTLITKNIDMVFTRFTASIDTVNARQAIKKIPLLLTSKYTKILNAPALVTFNEAKTDTEKSEYGSGEKTVAYLLEGRFTSLFANRQSLGFNPNAANASNIISKSPQTKMLVCSDGDLILNEIDKKSGNPFPMGFDKYSQHQFGNQDFVLNTLNYLLDESGLITAKSKSVGLRPLDGLKIENQKTQWQIINIAIPILLLAICGILRMWYIKKKYTST